MSEKKGSQPIRDKSSNGAIRDKSSYEDNTNSFTHERPKPDTLPPKPRGMTLSQSDNPALKK